MHQMIDTLRVLEQKTYIYKYKYKYIYYIKYIFLN